MRTCILAWLQPFHRAPTAADVMQLSTWQCVGVRAPDPATATPQYEREARGVRVEQGR